MLFLNASVKPRPAKPGLGLIEPLMYMNGVSQPGLDFDRNIDIC